MRCESPPRRMDLAPSGLPPRNRSPLSCRCSECSFHPGGTQTGRPTSTSDGYRPRRAGFCHFESRNRTAFFHSSSSVVVHHCSVLPGKPTLTVQSSVYSTGSWPGSPLEVDLSFEQCWMATHSLSPCISSCQGFLGGYTVPLKRLDMPGSWLAFADTCADSRHCGKTSQGRHYTWPHLKPQRQIDSRKRPTPRFA